MADKQYVEVAGRRIAYVEAGEGDPIVFLHGNPTSSYLWRNVIPHCEGVGRCLAPDLIGMGDSDKLDDSGPRSYRFVQHRDFIDGFLEAVGATDRVTFVIHDWGSALGFHWAHRHPTAVRGIAYMEAILRPISWSEFPEAAVGVFQGFRSPAGEEMVLDNNVFVEAVLPGSIMRQLTEEEMAEYRRPFLEPGESRRPTLTWPREIPIDGEPADVHEIVAAYSEWLGTSEIPKLFVHAEPGALIQGPTLDFARSFPNQTEIAVPGIHFVQEDSPDEIGRAVAAFVAGLD